MRRVVESVVAALAIASLTGCNGKSSTSQGSSAGASGAAGSAVVADGGNGNTTGGGGNSTSSGGAQSGGGGAGSNSIGGAHSGGKGNNGGAHSGGNGSSNGGAQGGDGGASGDAASACEPLLNQAEADTGFEACGDGSKRRRAAIQCPTEQTSSTSPCRPGVGPPDCMSDAECTQQAHGYCADAHKLTGYCGCYYGCRQDSDCQAASLCECGVVVGHCVAASCATNADCSPGFGCVATVKGTAGTSCNKINPASASSYACQSAADRCHGDKDCPASGSNPGVCLLDGDHRACGTVCALTP